MVGQFSTAWSCDGSIMLKCIKSLLISTVWSSSLDGYETTSSFKKASKEHGFRRTILAGVRPRYIERIATMKSQRFLNWVCYLALVAFGMSNLTGCSVLALAGRSTQETGTETRPTQKLAKKDVKMVFIPKYDELIFRLQHEPHYREESRSIRKISTDPYVKKLMPLVGLTEFLLIIAYAFEATDVDSLKKEGIRYKGDMSLWFHDDDLELKPWVNKAAIGIGLDFLLWLTIPTSSKQSFTPWKPSGTAPGTLEPIPNHPVSISLPQFQYQNTYHTNADGKFTISASDLIGKISNLDPLLNDKYLEVVASAKVDGSRQSETFMISSRASGPLFQALYDEADYRRKALPANLLTETAFSDAGDFIPNNTLDAGERNGRLQITVNNKGQGPGFGVQLHLSTDHPGVQLAEQTRVLGNIEPNGKEIIVVPITTSLQATDGFAEISVEAKEMRGYDARKRVHRIPVARLQPPSLAITEVEVNDRTLGKWYIAEEHGWTAPTKAEVNDRILGNGNSIVENGETIELNVFIHNGGTGDALATRLELAGINQGIDVLVKSANLGTIRPNQTVQGILRFHVPRTFVASALECKLRVSELRLDAVSQTKSYPVKQLAPRLEIDYRLIADDNGDEKMQQGEQIEFELTVTNNGHLDALNTRMKVSVSDTRIRINPSERTPGKLASNYTSSPQRFTFTIPRAVPAGELSIVVEVTHDDFPKVERTFNLMVYEEEIAVTK